MKKSFSLWSLLGFAVSSLLGTILHFLYDWTGSNVAALFSSVNESTWEHMKLLFIPMFLFAVVQYFIIGKEYDNYWCVKFKSIMLGIVLIPVIFYTLRGVFGTTPDWINISIFFISAAIAYIYEARQFKEDDKQCRFGKLALAILCIIAALFFIFTFYPLQIPLFRDPLSGEYGIV
jgi:hypothetical protein